MVSFRISVQAACLTSLVSSMVTAPNLLAQSSVFGTLAVDANQFVLVAAPIGSGVASQLNIYEQRTSERPCYRVVGGSPSVVDPLLTSFDFTGICSRYIDANGYSLRIGNKDLGTSYRLSIVKTAGDIQLVAMPTRNISRRPTLVATAGGITDGFVQLNLEPGWSLMRRQYGGQGLGHLYLYRETWPKSSDSDA
ncbi:hypothetical protein OMCYN_01557 [cyanobiont of Ornithocercus magnificus]|nr:hypothetical protein OMCYN_01557 [cyanobiont of Ornithocercus magnificus]